MFKILCEGMCQVKSIMVGFLFLQASFVSGQVPVVTPASCGATMRDLSDSILITPVVGVQQYRVRFIDVTNPANPIDLPALTTPGAYFTPAHVQGIKYDRIYKVFVDANTSDGWAAGGACILYSPAFPHSRIVNTMCGVTLKNLSDQLMVQQVPAASDYEFLIQDSDGTILGVDNPAHPTPYFYTPSWHPAIQFGKRYIFSVRPQVSGQWRAYYGPSCAVTMPSFPKTTISRCPRVLSALNEQIQAVPMSGFTAYEFEITDTKIPSKKAVLRRDHPNFWEFYLTWKPFSDLPIEKDHAYVVRVRGWRATTAGPWSDGCEIKTPPAN